MSIILAQRNSENECYGNLLTGICPLLCTSYDTDQCRGNPSGLQSVSVSMSVNKPSPDTRYTGNCHTCSRIINSFDRSLSGKNIWRKLAAGSKTIKSILSTNLVQGRSYWCSTSTTLCSVKYRCIHVTVILHCTCLKRFHQNHLTTVKWFSRC